jgi:hypothetical protein
MPKTGSRKIVVDGVSYRWRIRQRPPTATVDDGGPLVFCAELIGTTGSVLVVALPQSREVGWGGLYDYDQSPATPGQVADAIRQALRAGWVASKPGKPFLFDAMWPSQTPAAGGSNI